MQFANLLKLCVILILAKSIHGKTKCDSLRNAFAEAISEFERCAVQKAVPVSMCSDCLKLYIANLQNFSELISTQDDNNVRMNCGDHYIDQNSLNIVYKRYMDSRNLWDSGHCTNCFVATCNPNKMSTTDNITQICQPNANVGQIKAKIENLQICINESNRKKGDICKDCAQNHTQIENHLNQLMSGGVGVCFEIIDVVNSTNQMWYNEHKCPKPSPKSVSTIWFYPFIVIFVLAVLGTGGFFAFKKYRNHSDYVEHHDDTEESTNSFS